MAISTADVRDAYLTYLGRNPGKEEIQEYAGRDIDREGLAQIFKSSEEYKSLSPEDRISRQFNDLLKRDPTESEVSRILSQGQFYQPATSTMGGQLPASFDDAAFRAKMKMLPEVNLVRVFDNYLGRLPDEEAYRNYLKPAGKSADDILDQNYEFAMEPKRLEEVGWSPEAQERTNNRFEAEARAYAAEKGVELPEDFAVLSQYRNPWQDNAAGLEGLNLMTQIGYGGTMRDLDYLNQYDVYGNADFYKLPTYASWFDQVGRAAFRDEKNAQQAIKDWGPQAAVDAYAADPAKFLKESAAGVYANSWLEQNIDPGATSEGKNTDKLAGLADRYKQLSNRAIEAGASPDDVAKYTSERVSNVADEWSKYYKDHKGGPGFLEFLLLAGGLMIGAYGLSQLAGAGAGSVAGTGLQIGAGQGLAPGLGASIGAGAAPIGAGSVGLTAGAGTGLAPGIGASLGAGVGTIGAGAIGLQAPAGVITPTFGVPGYVGTNVPSDIFSKPTFPSAGGSGTTTTTLPSWSTEGVFKTPTMPGGGGGGPTATTGPSFIDDVISTGKNVYNKVISPLNKITNLAQALSGQPTQQTQTGGLSSGNVINLPVSTNIMLSPEEILERMRTRRTFVGGLEAVRNLG